MAQLHCDEPAGVVALYASPVPQAMQAEAPEPKVFAGHREHALLVVGEQVAVW